MILGLDISLNGTGICLLKPGNKTRSSKIVPPKDCVGVDRLAFVRKQVRALLYEYEPDLIIIEGYAFSRQHAHSMGEMGGVIKLLIRQLGLTAMAIPPSTLKCFILGPSKKGESGKDKMMMTIFKKYGKEFETADEADAYSLCAVGAAMLGKYTAYTGGTLTADQRTRLTKVTGVTCPEGSSYPKLPRIRA